MASLTASPVVFKVAAKKTVAARQPMKVTASMDMGKAAAAAALSLSFAMNAQAATIKLGSDSGALVFEPAEITVAVGEKVEFVNNRGFPHNIVFDEDEIPAGVDADAISHEDYLNGPGDTEYNTFDTPGEYGYYCEPHQGAGMVGKIIVE